MEEEIRKSLAFPFTAQGRSLRRQSRYQKSSSALASHPTSMGPPVEHFEALPPVGVSVDPKGTGPIGALVTSFLPIRPGS